jgi:gamma-glutamylcyclotransferase (GGCT)/AIG2-like uncharacterized protein YtfP
MIIDYEEDLDKTDQVFVYGTLKSGYGNNRLLGEPARLLSLASIPKELGFVMVNMGAFPALMRANSAEENTTIFGELWGPITPNIFQRLDFLEGCPRFYQRKVIEVSGSLRIKIPAWVYFIDQLGPMTSARTGTIVTSGEWK